MLLSQTEREWILGSLKLSKGHERKIKSAIKKKIENFQKFELSLLIRKGILDYPDVTKISNTVTKYSNTPNGLNILNYDNFNFAINNMKNYQFNGSNFKNFGGPDVIRTREPRHVKAVS
jgi:hypothetical protein